MENDSSATVLPDILVKNGSSEIPILMFGWTDYTLFTMMLGLSALIGIYFGCFGKKQDTTAEYLLGSKKMGIFPIAMSLVASHVSGITLLGVPADVYKFGATYWLCVFCIVIVGTVVATVYLPVFYKLQLTSSYEYLKLRFDTKIRIFASLLFAISVVLFLPMVIYIPALAFSQVTGINLHLITPVVCMVCIFYTTLGGLKAVVWTDTLQFSVTIGAMVTVFCLGLNSAGGLAPVWNKAVEGHRLDIFDMDPDPTIRDGFWAVVIGFTVSWISHAGVNQSCVQRFLSVPSLSDARKSILVFVMGIAIVKTVSVFTGFIMFAKYSDCDPLTTGSVKRADQLLPYYVMDVAGDIYGLPGLFVAGVVSAALSTLSAHLNTLAGTIYEDFVSPYMSKNTTDKTASNILKSIVVVTGVICVGLVFIIEHLGGILPLAISLSGITSGPLLGLFTLGMLFPSANTKGALYGGIGSLAVLFWIVIGAQYHIANGNIKHIPKPLSVEQCDFYINATTPAFNTTIPVEHNEVFFMYRISFYYYTMIGTLTVLLIGLPVSWLTRKDGDPEVDIDLLSPVIHWMLPKRKQDKGRYYSVEKALHLITIKPPTEKEMLNLPN